MASLCISFLIYKMGQCIIHFIGLLWQLGELGQIKYLEWCLGRNMSIMQLSQWSHLGSAHQVSDKPAATTQGRPTDGHSPQGSRELPGTWG